MTTLLIGLDAASPSILEDLFDGNSLPQLRSIFRDGTSGVLESQIPPWTASAWPSLYTGMNPGKHGVFGFLTFDGYEWDVVNATDVRERTLWEFLSQHGHSSVVVNVPVTHPPRQFDGALVPGYSAPESPRCHPEGLLEEIRENRGEYLLYPPHEGDGGDSSLAEKIDQYRTLVGMRGRVFKYLVDQFDPDFGFVQFQATDTVFHECPGEREAIESVYEAVDDQIGTILEACRPDNVIVASDHGMGRYEGSQFQINEFLRRQGMLTATRGGAGMPAWTTIRDDQLREDAAASDVPLRALESIATALARIGLTSRRLGTVLRRLGLAETVGRHVPSGMFRAATEQVDFPGSRAYVRDAVELGIRINLEGRDPAGIVSREQYEPLREELIESLTDMRTPDGDLVFDDVAPREEFFHGPEIERAVDVVTVPRKFDHALSTRLADELFREPIEPWNHKLDGVVAATGEGIDPRASVENAHLLDIAPTVLATMGVPRDERMDGVPLPLVTATEERSYERFNSGKRMSTSDPAVEQRLSDLGYIE